MNPTMSHTDLTVPSDVLAGAATAAARHAPSILNTQPWRWRVSPGRLELFAEPRRHLAVTDPDGRLLLLSCGAVLHHASGPLVDMLGVRTARAFQPWAARATLA